MILLEDKNLSLYSVPSFPLTFRPWGEESVICSLRELPRELVLVDNSRPSRAEMAPGP